MSQLRRKIKAILRIVSGIVLCVVLAQGIIWYQMVKHPYGAVTNSDFKTVEIASKRGDHLCDLHKGESKPLEYGTYKITIVDTKHSFLLSKNNRGVCNICSSNGVLAVNTDGNCGVGDGQY
jgi:hypothetical protein